MEGADLAKFRGAATWIKTVSDIPSGIVVLAAFEVCLLMGFAVLSAALTLFFIFACGSQAVAWGVTVDRC